MTDSDGVQFHTLTVSNVFTVFTDCQYSDTVAFLPAIHRVILVWRRTSSSLPRKSKREVVPVLFIHQWFYSTLLGSGLFFNFDGGTPWTSDQIVAGPLPTHRPTQTQNKRTHRHRWLEWDSNR
jgi:hypothetical protein